MNVFHHQVTFPSGAVVRIGEKLSAAEIKEEPMVEWKANESALYSIFMQSILVIGYTRNLVVF